MLSLGKRTIIVSLMVIGCAGRPDSHPERPSDIAAEAPPLTYRLSDGQEFFLDRPQDRDWRLAVRRYSFVKDHVEDVIEALAYHFKIDSESRLPAPTSGRYRSSDKPTRLVEIVLRLGNERLPGLLVEVTLPSRQYFDFHWDGDPDRRYLWTGEDALRAMTILWLRAAANPNGNRGPVNTNIMR